MSSDSMSAAMMICNSMEIDRLYDQVERRRARDAVIDDLINRHNWLAANNAALQADYSSLAERFNKVADSYNRQLQQIAELERQLNEAQTTIRDLNTMVKGMRPVFERYCRHWLSGS